LRQISNEEEEQEENEDTTFREEARNTIEDDELANFGNLYIHQ
jgi:hypothetical protein